MLQVFYNHMRWASEANGTFHLSDKRDWVFVMDNGPNGIGVGYRESLDGLVFRAADNISSANTLSMA